MNELDKNPLGFHYKQMSQLCIEKFVLKYDLFYNKDLSLRQLEKLYNEIDFKEENYYNDEKVLKNRKTYFYMNMIKMLYNKMINEEIENIENYENNIKNGDFIFKQYIITMLELWIISCEKKKDLEKEKIIKNIINIMEILMNDLAIERNEMIIEEKNGIVSYQNIISYNFMPITNVLLNKRIYICNTYKYIYPVLEKLILQDVYLQNISMSYCKHIVSELIKTLQLFSESSRKFFDLKPQELKIIITIILKLLSLFNYYEFEQMRKELLCNMKNINYKFFSLFFKLMEFEQSISFQIVYLYHLESIINFLESSPNLNRDLNNLENHLNTVTCYNYVYTFRIEIIKCICAYGQKCTEFKYLPPYKWFVSFANALICLSQHFIMTDLKIICKVILQLIELVCNENNPQYRKIIQFFDSAIPKFRQVIQMLDSDDEIQLFKYNILNDKSFKQVPKKYEYLSLIFFE